jgi:hypothetical protein
MAVPKVKAAKKTLHFFPGPKVMLWVIDGAIIEKGEAWGGEMPDPSITYKVMKPRPTTPGKYIVQSYAPYRTNTWPLSKIRWGTPLKVDGSTGDVLYDTGQRKRRWVKLTDLLGPGATLDAIKAEYKAKYGSSGKYDADGDGVPDAWVFNDFGPMAVRYFRDANHNRKLDNGEFLSGEMIHTTPKNEAQTAVGDTVALEASHGCIHLRPADRDRFNAAGAFRPGTDLVIHKYTEAVPVKIE